MLRRMNWFKLYCVSVFIFTLATPLVQAQFSSFTNPTTGTSNGSGAYLQVLPQYYEPNSTVSVELNSYSINTNGATIQWFVDSTAQPNFQNEHTLQLTTGELGTSQTVRAILTQASGIQIPLATTITPIRVDMLVEADTLTPAFYRGRSLPTSGSAVRVTALPFTGTNQDPSQFSYSWQVGEDAINGGSSRPGENSVTFTPSFDTSPKVQVTIFDSEGAIVATRSIRVPIVEPELHFYEINPLRGIQTTALDADYIFQGSEMQVRAEPYYMSRGLQAEDLHIAWKINNRSISNPSTDPQQISLRRQGDMGMFTLEFEIRNLNQLLQGIKDDITFQF